MLGSSGTGTFEPLNLMYSEQLLGDNESQMKVSQSLQLNSQRRSQDEALCLQEAQKLQAQATELFGQNKEQEEKKEEEESEDSEEDDGAKLEFQLVWHPGKNDQKYNNFFQTYFYDYFIYSL